MSRPSSSSQQLLLLVLLPFHCYVNRPFNPLSIRWMTSFPRGYEIGTITNLTVQLIFFLQVLNIKSTANHLVLWILCLPMTCCPPPWHCIHHGHCAAHASRFSYSSKMMAGGHRQFSSCHGCMHHSMSSLFEKPQRSFHIFNSLGSSFHIASYLAF